MTFRDGWPPFYEERSVGNDFGNDAQWFLLYSALLFFVGFIVVSPGQRGLEVTHLLTEYCTEAHDS